MARNNRKNLRSKRENRKSKKPNIGWTIKMLMEIKTDKEGER